ncbi:phage tail protein [Euzebya rosea]|uniref:phage tail protein n=1 Tax=Euzebya rosea TaxID=2052804 RepID=UPI000D3E084C|nr:tail fiber protein [Euzebya rosea]
MSEPFLAEIRIFAGNFAPRSWALCNGQLLPIAQNTALFSLIGTTYGGDGRTTTQLPDLQGRLPMHPGRGPGLTARQLGERDGAETVTLNASQVPNHDHSATAVDGLARDSRPEDNRFAAGRAIGHYVDATAGSAAAMTPLGSSGGGQAHNNLMPSLALSYIIALVGLYPSRS